MVRATEAAMTRLKTRLALAVGIPAALAMVGGAIAFAADSGGAADSSTMHSQHQYHQAAGHHGLPQAPSIDAQAAEDDYDCPNKNKGTTEDATAADQT